MEKTSKDRKELEKITNYILRCLGSKDSSFKKECISKGVNAKIILNLSHMYRISISYLGMNADVIVTREIEDYYKYKIELSFKTQEVSEFYYGHGKITRSHPDFVNMMKNLFTLAISSMYDSENQIEFLKILYTTPKHYRKALKKSIKWITHNIDPLEYYYIFFNYTADSNYEKATENILKLMQENPPPALEENIHVYRAFKHRTLKQGVINEPLSTSLELYANVKYNKKNSQAISKKVLIKKGTVVFPILYRSKFPEEFELLIQPFTYIDLSNPPKVIVENALDRNMIEHSTHRNAYIKKSIRNITTVSNKYPFVYRNKENPPSFQRAKTSTSNSNKKVRKTKKEISSI